MGRKEVQHRQVIVIGAGPAGSACAQKLAEEGIDVLIIERREIVGNPAQCGECIPNWGEVVGTFFKSRRASVAEGLLRIS